MLKRETKAHQKLTNFIKDDGTLYTVDNSCTAQKTSIQLELLVYDNKKVQKRSHLF